MNARNVNSVLLVSILLTLGLMAGAHFIPDKKLLLIPDSKAKRYIAIEPLPDGTPSAKWTDETRNAWSCNAPANYQANYFPCGLTVYLSNSVDTGLDLSKFNSLNLHLDYEGSANKVRIAIRNYNRDYSKPEDGNSTKFNAIQIHSEQLNKELHLSLTSFAVADWWLRQYNIPLSRSAPEMDNSMVITVDFGEPPPPGIHKFEIKKIELQGEWINVEYWYLAILSLWMLGIFIYTIKRMIELRAQTKHATQVINQLSNSNEELKAETNKFRRLSTVDPLTQLYNRFGIDQIVSSLSGNNYQCATDTANYSLLVADIDHFKQVNDKYGHDSGDLVLQHVAQIMQSSLRSGDYVGRWGGEEFVVIMPNTSKENAMEMAEKIRTSIFTTPCSPNKLPSISASFGVSERHPHEDFASCFKRADNALYKAKAQGRNCCVFAEENLHN